MSSAGGKWKNAKECGDLFLSLFKRSPDITWVNEAQKILINNDWKVAYEEGRWTESWAEPDGRATIRGKYVAMWKQENGPWLLHAMIFTPLSCTGESNYCRPK